MEINLLPWREEIIEYNKKILFRLLLAAIILGGCFLIFAYHLFFAQVSYTKSYTQALEEAKVNLVGNVSAYFTQKKIQKEVSARYLVLQQLQLSRFDTVRFLNEIVKITPKGIYFSTLARNDNQIKISGAANSNLLITEFMQKIQQSLNLKTTSLEKVEKKEGANLIVTHFDLQAALTLPPLLGDK